MVESELPAGVVVGLRVEAVVGTVEKWQDSTTFPAREPVTGGLFSTFICQRGSVERREREEGEREGGGDRYRERGGE